MANKELSIGVPFALEQIAHERKVIEAFARDTQNENVASVTLQVSGIDHTILIHEQDYTEFADLLMKFNRKEKARLESRVFRFNWRNFGSFVKKTLGRAAL